MLINEDIRKGNLYVWNYSVVYEHFYGVTMGILVSLTCRISVKLIYSGSHESPGSTIINTDIEFTGYSVTYAGNQVDILDDKAVDTVGLDEEVFFCTIADTINVHVVHF